MGPLLGRLGHKIMWAGALGGQGMGQDFVDGIGPQFVAVYRACAIESRQLAAIVLGMNRVFQIDGPANMHERIGGEAAFDRPGLDQAHLHAGAFKLHPERQ